MSVDAPFKPYQRKFLLQHLLINTDPERLLCRDVETMECLSLNGASILHLMEKIQNKTENETC